MPRVNLEGSSSIVTGGASGIGEACAHQLAEAGSESGGQDHSDRVT